MALSKIKKEFADTVIAFGNGGGPLKDRQDIDELAIIALESQDPTILNLFETLPTLNELKKTKVDAELNAAAAKK